METLVEGAVARGGLFGRWRGRFGGDGGRGGGLRDSLLRCWIDWEIVARFVVLAVVMALDL